MQLLYPTYRDKGRGGGMNFTISSEIEAHRVTLRDFIQGEVMPLEADPSTYDAHENIAPDQLEAMRAKAKTLGIWAPQAPVV